MHEKNYHIIMIPSELGCGKRGAGMGPDAIMYADINRKGSIFTRYPFSKVEVYNEELLFPSAYPFAKYIDHIVRVTDNAIALVTDCLSERRFPIILSGDHSNAIGPIAAIRNFYPDKRLGVIWIDAHGDLHSPYTTPSGNLHGMPLAVSLGDVYRSVELNAVDEETLYFWKKLTHAGDNHIHPKLQPRDVVLIDIRDLEEPEWKDIADNQIKYFGPEQVKKSNISDIAAETLEYLKHCDLIYVSFDVDSMDPSVSRGTGTSSPDGITLQNAIELLTSLFTSPKLAALEITEVNPLVDTENKMARSVLEILDSII